MAEDRDERAEEDAAQDSEGGEKVPAGTGDEDESGGEADVLDIDLEDLADDDETPPVPSAEVLEITLDDLDGIEDEAGQYPGVDAAALEAEKHAADEIQMYCLCSDTGQPFHIYWREASPGIFSVSRVDTAAEQSVGGGADPSAIAGQFLLEDFPGCPWCGCRQVGVCDGCGTTICEAGVQTTWTGRRTLKCPSCGQRGDLGGEADTAYGARGGKGKGKKG